MPLPNRSSSEANEIFPPFVFCSLYAMLNVGGAALIKNDLLAWGAEGRALSRPSDFVEFLFRPKVVSGFAIILISALVLFKALAEERFSLVIPLSTGINFTLTVLVGIFVFRDRIDLLQAAGLVLVLGGILLLSRAGQPS